MYIYIYIYTTISEITMLLIWFVTFSRRLGEIYNFKINNFAGGDILASASAKIKASRSNIDN